MKLRTTPMMLRLLATIALLLGGAGAQAQPLATAATAAPVRVNLDTSLGRIVLQLEPARAPKSVANFVAYVKSGYYDGLIFHRVIPGFMVQGGGYDAQFGTRPLQPPVVNEADNGLKNLRGSVAMARSRMPHSAASEFFINLVDNNNLDAPSFDGWGYTVFGQVVEGMDVVDKIAAIPTGAGGTFAKDVPKTPVLVTKAALAVAANTAPKK